MSNLTDTLSFSKTSCLACRNPPSPECMFVSWCQYLQLQLSAQVAYTTSFKAFRMLCKHVGQLDSWHLARLKAKRVCDAFRWASHIIAIEHMTRL